MSNNHSVNMHFNHHHHHQKNNEDTSSLSSMIDSENNQTNTGSSFQNHAIHNNSNSSSLLLGGDLSSTPSKQALTIVRGISSYLSLSDAESIGSLVSSSTTRSLNSSSRRRSHNNNNSSSRKESLSWSTMTPSSPFHPPQQNSNNADAAAGFGIQVKVSVQEEEEDDDDDRPGLASLEEEDDELEDVYEPWRQHIQQQQQQQHQKNKNNHTQKQMIQSLSQAVMSHPESIKSLCCTTTNTKKKKSIKPQHYFCNDCQSTFLTQLFYKNPKTLQQLLVQQRTTTTTTNEQPTSCLTCGYHHQIQQLSTKNLNDDDDNDDNVGFLGQFVQRVPLSILIDFAEHVLHLSLDTTFSSCEISVHSIHSILSTLSPIIQTIWMDIVEFLNPIALIHTLSKLLFLQSDDSIISRDYHHHHPHHHHHVSSSNSIMSQSSFLGKMNPFLRSNHNHDSSIIRDHVISEKVSLCQLQIPPPKKKNINYIIMERMLTHFIYRC